MIRKLKGNRKVAFLLVDKVIDKQLQAVEKDADFVFAILVGVQGYDRDRKDEKLQSP